MRILYSVCFNVAIHHSINGKTGNRLDAQFFSNVLAVGDNGGQAISLLISPLVISINTSISRTDNSCSVFSMCIALSAACFLA